MSDRHSPARRARGRPADVVPLKVALQAWWRISLQTFGGPAGQISVMHRELVEQRRRFGEGRFLHALSYCTLLPGPEAQQLGIYLGWLLNGTLGVLIAGVLFVLPGFVAIMGLSVLYAGWGDMVAVTPVHRHSRSDRRHRQPGCVRQPQIGGDELCAVRLCLSRQASGMSGLTANLCAGAASSRSSAA